MRSLPSLTLPPTCITIAVCHRPVLSCRTSTRLPLTISSGGGKAEALAALLAVDLAADLPALPPALPGLPTGVSDAFFLPPGVAACATSVG